MAEAKVKSLQSKERKLGSKMAEYAEYAALGSRVGSNYSVHLSNLEYL